MELTDIEELKEQLLTCHLCAEEAFSEGIDFLTLPCPCQHTICEKCLCDMLRKKRCHEPPQCPWCRQELVLPESGKLPKFRFAAQLSEELKSFGRRAKILPEPKTKSQVMKLKKERREFEKLALLQKLDFEGSNFRFVCAGEGGIFYGYLWNSEGLSCLACINVMGDGTLTRFGNLSCFYDRNSSMMYNEEELFVVNHTQQCIEVYKNINFVRSWKITTGLTLMAADICPIPDNGLRVATVTYSGNYLESCPFYTLRRHYSVDGVELKFSLSSSKSVIDNSPILTVYKDSCWILNKEDKHLWEIPMEMSINTITCKEPVKHCKVGDVTNACRWGRDKILFTSGRLVKVLDLEAIKTAHNSQATALSRCRQRATARKPMVKASVHNLLGSVYQESDKILVSDDGHVVVIGQNSCVTAYKLLQTNCTPTLVEISDTNISGPVYPTHFDRLCTLWNACKRLCFILLNVVPLLFLLLCFSSYLFNSLQWLMDWLLLQSCATGTCFDYQCSTYGWANLYISLCNHPMESSSV